MLNKSKPDTRAMTARRRKYCWVLWILGVVTSMNVTLNAQLDQNCVVSVLNRTVQANPDGSWVILNVPANLGQVRARATCVRDGATSTGQSDFFTPQANGTVNAIKITF